MEKNEQKLITPINCYDWCEPLIANRFLVRFPKEAFIPEWKIMKAKITTSAITVRIVCVVDGMNTCEEFTDFGRKFNELDGEKRIISIEDLDPTGNVVVSTDYCGCSFMCVLRDTKYDYNGDDLKTYDLIFPYESCIEHKIKEICQKGLTT